MNTPTTSTPAPGKPQPRSDMKCYVKDQPSGGLSVTYQIDVDTAKRLKLRAGPMPLDRYIWENILKPAMSTHCY